MSHLEPSPTGQDLSSIEIDLMRKKHLDHVMEIERRAYSNPWSRGVFESELEQGISRTYLIAHSGRTILGYCGSLYVLDEAHITNIAVDIPFRHLHVGTRLLSHSIRRAWERNIVNVTLEVRVSNAGAQRLYHKFGFQPAGVRKGYYQENGEDALIMWAYDIDTAEYHERIAQIEARAGIPDHSVRRRKRLLWR